MYILVVDDEADIRELMEVILKKSFPLDVALAKSGREAIEIILKSGMPEVVICDMNMPDGDGNFVFSKIKEEGWNIPFALCSTEIPNVEKKFPGMIGFIEKPNILGPLIKLVSSVVNKRVAASTYVPVRISLLLRRGSTSYDLFMKLSDSNFVKVFSAGDAFVASDAERFTQKGLQHLFISSSDADMFVKSFEQSMSLLFTNHLSDAPDLPKISLESIETVERIAKTLGWKPEVIEAAKFAVSLAIRAVESEPSLMKLVKQKMRDPESKYSTHVNILSLVACGLCQNLGWTSESTQMKLGLAALIHDLTVDETCYSSINDWNTAASSKNDNRPEVQQYRNHPLDAAHLILSLKNIPADVDQIILQHHETHDGTGFPRKIMSSRITPMASVFIITEDLIHFIDDAQDVEERLQTFLRLRETLYDSGNFRKVLDSLRDSVQKTNSGP